METYLYFKQEICTKAKLGLRSLVLRSQTIFQLSSRRVLAELPVISLFPTSSLVRFFSSFSFPQVLFFLSPAGGQYQHGGGNQCGALNQETRWSFGGVKVIVVIIITVNTREILLLF